jgi:hypothetical protein
LREQKFARAASGVSLELARATRRVDKRVLTRLAENGVARSAAKTLAALAVDKPSSRRELIILINPICCHCPPVAMPRKAAKYHSLKKIVSMLPC